MNELLVYYQAAVLTWRASGFEHLQMFDIRDELETIKAGLSSEERKALSDADVRLMTQSHLFYAEIAKVADLAQERLRHAPPATHWWWYLDVVAQLPISRTNGTALPVAVPA